MTILTVGDYWERRKDNFLMLRIFAAVAVIYGHSFALSFIRGGKDFVQQYVGSTHVAHEAVSVFFVISGFLVAGSFVTRADVRFFIRARVLRVFPGLIACILFTTFLLGAWVTTLSLTEYFSSDKTFTYLLKNITLYPSVTFWLPGVFEDHRINGVNGSLWTLPAEIRMYFLLGLIGLFGFLTRRGWFNALLLALIFVGVFYPNALFLVSDNPKYFRLAAMFVFGVWMFVNRNHIPLHGGVVLLLLLIAVLFHGSDHFMIAFSIFIAYTTIWFAYVPEFGLDKYLQDVSYGLYIYAFPVQQTVVYAFPEMGPYVLFVVATTVTAIFALLSWTWIEKPALQFKNKKIFGIL